MRCQVSVLNSPMAVPNPPAHIAAIFEGFPETARDGLYELRRLIFETASEFPDVGQVEECLKWGQPSYTTPTTKSGSTLRLGCPKSGGFALFAHCQTNIIRTFSETFPGLDQIDGNRAVIFNSVSDIAPWRHKQVIAHALRYHLLK